MYLLRDFRATFASSLWGLYCHGFVHVRPIKIYMLTREISSWQIGYAPEKSKWPVAVAYSDRTAQESGIAILDW